MLGVPDAVQRFFSGAPQSRDPRVVQQDGPRISSASHPGAARSADPGVLRSIRGTPLKPHALIFASAPRRFSDRRQSVGIPAPWRPHRAAEADRTDALAMGFPLTGENMLAAGGGSVRAGHWGSLDPIGNTQEKHTRRS
jgi:hypothetical protein